MSAELIFYDPQGVLLSEHGLTADDLPGLESKLNAARDEVLSDGKLWAAGGDVPAEKDPLDAGFQELPERLLARISRARRGERSRANSSDGRQTSGGSRPSGRARHRRFVHGRAGR